MREHLKEHVPFEEQVRSLFDEIIAEEQHRSSLRIFDDSVQLSFFLQQLLKVYLHGLPEGAGKRARKDVSPE